MKTTSVHLLCELTGCDQAKINDLAYIKTALSAAAVAANTTILNGYFHQFEPSGVSGVLCLSESHISVHTWPEAGYAAVDIFTCGDHAVPLNAVTHMTKALGAQHAHVVNMLRGVPGEAGRYVSMRTARPYAQSEVPVLLCKPAGSKSKVQGPKSKRIRQSQDAGR